MSDHYDKKSGPQGKSGKVSQQGEDPTPTPEEAQRKASIAGADLDYQNAVEKFQEAQAAAKAEYQKVQDALDAATKTSAAFGAVGSDGKWSDGTIKDDLAAVEESKQEVDDKTSTKDTADKEAKKAADQAEAAKADLDKATKAHEDAVSKHSDDVAESVKAKKDLDDQTRKEPVAKATRDKAIEDARLELAKAKKKHDDAITAAEDEYKCSMKDFREQAATT